LPVSMTGRALGPISIVHRFCGFLLYSAVFCYIQAIKKIKNVRDSEI